MSDRSLPDRPNLEQYKKQAKELARDASAGQPDALARFHRHHPRVRNLTESGASAIALADAQLVLAREHGYDSWPKFAQHIEKLRLIRDLAELNDPVSTFLEVATVDRGWHGSGTLEHAEMILARYPNVVAASIYTAAVLGDEAVMRAQLKRDGLLATAKGGPHAWDALTYLCFSRYLRIDKPRSDGFVAAARALLEAGVSANTGWTDAVHDPAHT
jgi:hypothetical protein